MTGDLLELPAGKCKNLLELRLCVKSCCSRLLTSYLSIESKLKKVLTAEEHAMRRAELARRRKNLSEKRNEEEKVSLYRHELTLCVG